MQRLASPLAPNLGQTNVPPRRQGRPVPRILRRAEAGPNDAPHNAFVDAVEWNDEFWGCFSQGTLHASPDHITKVMRSANFRDWEVTSTFTSRTPHGLRDGHLIPLENELLLAGVEYTESPASVTHQSVLWRSRDGINWDAQYSIGDPNVWIWRVRQRGSVLYAVGYAVDPANGFIRLYASDDWGYTWRPVSYPVYGYYPNEVDMIWDDDETMHILVRRDSGGLGHPTTALLVSAPHPYVSWTSQDLGIRHACPVTVRMEDGRVVVCGRYYSPSRTSVSFLDIEQATLTEVLEIARSPTGDTAYPGAVWDKNFGRILYYNEQISGETKVYAAEVLMLGDWE